MAIFRRREPKLVRDAKDMTRQTRRSEELRKQHGEDRKRRNKHDVDGHGRCRSTCSVTSSPHYR